MTQWHKQSASIPVRLILPPVLQVAFARIGCIIGAVKQLGYRPLSCLEGKAATQLLGHPGLEVIHAAAVHPAYQFTRQFADMKTLAATIHQHESTGELPTAEWVAQVLQLSHHAAVEAGRCAGKIVGECSRLPGPHS